MDLELVSWFANIVQICTTFIALAGYLPQMLKIYKSKCSDSMSVGSWLLWTCSSAGALFYATVQQIQTNQAAALLFSSMVGFTLVFCMLIMIIRYQSKQPARRKVEIAVSF